MKNVFASYFAADEGRRDRLWQDCFFVFDTNVLTSVYKRSDDARDALYKIIESLGERLWIPYQVAFELLENRASIAHTQSGFYADAIENLKSVLDGFDSANRHPFLPGELHKEFVSVSERVIYELEVKRDFHDSRLTNDDVKSAFADMLNNKVGARYSEEQLKAIVKEGEIRYANKIPPGFEDVNKHKGSQVFGDICKRYGDLIIWKQVIEKAKVLNKPVIMVTGEQKDDWWDRHGGKTIGPLPKLIEEFVEEVGQDFYLYSHHQFLDLANKHLKQNTSSEVIEEVREAAITDALSLESQDSYADGHDNSLVLPFNEIDLPWNDKSLPDNLLLTQQMGELKLALKGAITDRSLAKLRRIGLGKQVSVESKAKAAIYHGRERSAEARMKELTRKIRELELLMSSTK
ncbi:hypothetical protein PSCICO_42750 [Pseudomonas cichorii]|uniref:PIN-like domain-containing protein n=1 Tax=Pseudomonas cichorii TaxID=36746 RepID=UPI0019105177|nr:PIN-like domain-containing protein [Pseudomonas cichorii]GFM88876.1 hypothetical protein PSCICO_42750 [Pseudomonas cichorii]